MTAAVLEATGIYWEAPYEALEKAGIEPILVQAQHVKQIKGRKTDVADSVWLARICQFGLGSPSLIPPPLFRRLRKVSRLRRQLIRDRASLRNRIHKILDAVGPRIGGVLSDAFGVNGMRILEDLVAGKAPEKILSSLSPHVRHRLRDLRDALTARLDDTSRFLLSDLLDAYHQATARLTRYDTRLSEGLSGFLARIDLLMTIPGIDRSSARAILIELGPDILVLPSRRHCTAWAGLCPGNNESAGKRRASRTRRGNTTLREILIECAHGAAHTKDCQFEGFAKALTACGQSHAAFGRRCIPAEPRRFASLIVAFRSKYTRYSSLTRLVSRAPRRPRRSRHFIHRLLTVRRGQQAHHRRHRQQDAPGPLRRPQDRQALPGPANRLRSHHGPAERAPLDHHAPKTRYRSPDRTTPRKTRRLTSRRASA